LNTRFTATKNSRALTMWVCCCRVTTQKQQKPLLKLVASSRLMAQQQVSHSRREESCPQLLRSWWQKWWQVQSSTSLLVSRRRVVLVVVCLYILGRGSTVWRSGVCLCWCVTAPHDTCCPAEGAIGVGHAKHALQGHCPVIAQAGCQSWCLTHQFHVWPPAQLLQGSSPSNWCPALASRRLASS